MPELTSIPTETTIAAADELYFNKVAGTPDVLSRIAQSDLAASTTNVLTGTSALKFVTPDAIAALWEQGSNITSAGTISVGEGGYFHVTGTTTITDIDPATDKAGRGFWLVFDGALTLTHNASTLILPTGANITTAAGDAAFFVSEGADAVRCVLYQKKSGVPVALDTDTDLAANSDDKVASQKAAKAYSDRKEPLRHPPTPTSSDFTAMAGESTRIYGIDTSGGAVTATLDTSGNSVEGETHWYFYLFDNTNSFSIKVDGSDHLIFAVGGTGFDITGGGTVTCTVKGSMMAVRFYLGTTFIIDAISGDWT